MSRKSSGSMIIMVIGIVLAILCIIGVMVQAPIYIENADKKAPVVHAASGANGARGSFAQTLMAWSGSPAEAANTALNLIVFFCILFVVGIVLIWLGARGMRRERS